MQRLIKFEQRENSHSVLILSTCTIIICVVRLHTQSQSHILAAWRVVLEARSNVSGNYRDTETPRTAQSCRGGPARRPGRPGGLQVTVIQNSSGSESHKQHYCSSCLTAAIWSQHRAPELCAWWPASKCLLLLTDEHQRICSRTIESVLMTMQL